MSNYRILTASFTSDLALKVNDAMAKGFVPVGSPVFDGGSFHQAVLLSEEARETEKQAKRYRALRDWSINTSWSFVISHINEDAGRVTHSTHKGNKGTPEGMDEEIDDIIATLENP